MAEPQVSVIIPTYNESECIAGTLRAVAGALSEAGLEYELLVVDDSSTDGTQQEVGRLALQDGRVRLLERPSPRSFGGSVMDGMRIARGQLSVIVMADLSDDPKIIPEMHKKFLEGADVVVGSRFLPGSKIEGYPPMKMLSNRLFNLSVMLFFLTPVQDTSNNFKAFRTSLARSLQPSSKSFEVGAELMMLMLMDGRKISEIPAGWRDRQAGKAKFLLKRMFIKYFSLFIRMLALRARRALGLASGKADPQKS
jgi:dolichol-phosphate mannosyltransferase